MATIKTSLHGSVSTRPVLTLHHGLKGDPRQNRLLAALPAAEWQRWHRHLQPVDMPRGQVLYEPGSRLQQVYLPTTAIVALQHLTETGASAAVALVGNEGLVGISLFMGGESTTGRAVVQIAGKGFGLPAPVLMQEFNRAGVVMHLLLRYTQALITQITQTGSCNLRHSVDQQLCRWLLLSLDRTAGNELAITHELIAHILGVRREGVTDAAGHLLAAGLIHCRRGHIAVIDRPGIERRVCECYEVVRHEYARLLPPEAAR